MRLNTILTYRTVPYWCNWSSMKLISPANFSGVATGMFEGRHTSNESSS
jgi:hypothetical protein